MKVFCFIAWLDRCSFHRQVLVQRCSSPKYYPCPSNCIDSYEQSKLTITSYPPCRGIWERTSDKDHLNVIFTGIWTKSWFFGRKQDTQVVFWWGVITAKEEKEEEEKKKKEVENSVPEVLAVTQLSCTPLSDRFSTWLPHWTLCPWCG